MTQHQEPQVAQFDIGDMLASKRQQVQESLADAASNVRLSADIIEKLESNRFNEIGTAVYVRGYLSLYAKYLGLDAAYLIEQYNQQYPQEIEAIRPAAGQPFGETRRHSKRHSKTLSLLVVALVLGVLTYGYTQFERQLFNLTTMSTNESVNTTTISSDDNSLDATIENVSAAENLADDVLNGATIDNTLPLVSTLSLESVATTTYAQGKSTTEVDSNSESSVPVASTIDTPDAQPLLNTAQLRDVIKAEAVSQTPMKTSISLAFSSDCWVEVSDVDGKKLTARLYRADSTLNVSGKAPLNLVVGNPDVVTRFTVNDDIAKLADYKTEGRIRFRVTNKQ